MKRLIILRHAKSSWKDDSLSDHQRPLNKRGRRDAPRMGEALASRGWVPDLVLSSDATRTRQTWKRVARAMPDEIPVRWIPDFYHAGSIAVLKEMIDLPEEAGTVMVVGHNPGWENLVSMLSGRLERMTTANAALLQAEGSWVDLAEPDAWELVTVLRPKELDQ